LKKASIILRILLGSLFLFSGIVKLYPIEPFELLFVDIGITSWSFSPVFARIIIGIEIFIGLLFIFQFRPKVTALTALAVLLFFTAYLIYIIITEGNDSNCGCLGQLLPMTPLQSIGKNAVLLIACSLLLWKGKAISFQWKPLLVAIPLITAFSLPFILNPMNLTDYSASSNEMVLDLKRLPEIKVENTVVNLKEGEKIVAFLALFCEHCKYAAQKLSVLNKKPQAPEIYLILYGEEEKLSDFLNETKANFPYVLFNNPDFFTLTGGVFPSIFYLKDGQPIKRWTGKTFTYGEIENLKKI